MMTPTKTNRPLTRSDLDAPLEQAGADWILRLPEWPHCFTPKITSQAYEYGDAVTKVVELEGCTNEAQARAILRGVLDLPRAIDPKGLFTERPVEDGLYLFFGAYSESKIWLEISSGFPRPEIVRVGVGGDGRKMYIGRDIVYTPDEMVGAWVRIDEIASEIIALGRQEMLQAIARRVYNEVKQVRRESEIARQHLDHKMKYGRGMVRFDEPEIREGVCNAAESMGLIGGSSDQE